MRIMKLLLYKVAFMFFCGLALYRMTLYLKVVVSLLLVFSSCTLAILSNSPEFSKKFFHILYMYEQKSKLNLCYNLS